MMLHANKITSISIIVAILALGVLIMYVTLKDKPIDIIEKSFMLKLPSSSSIEEFSYYKDGNHFYAKILIHNQSIDYVKQQLYDFFKNSGKKVDRKLPNFTNTCSWWDLDTIEIDEYYMRFINEKNKLFRHTLKSRQVWAFISKNRNGQYYLYVSY